MPLLAKLSCDLFLTFLKKGFVLYKTIFFNILEKEKAVQCTCVLAVIS